MSKCNLNISYKYVQTVVKLHSLKIEMQTKLEEAIKTPANPRNSIGATIDSSANRQSIKDNTYH